MHLAVTYQHCQRFQDSSMQAAETVMPKNYSTITLSIFSTRYIYGYSILILIWYSTNIVNLFSCRLNKYLLEVQVYCQRDCCNMLIVELLSSACILLFSLYLW
jgi:hypothetical protein